MINYRPENYTTFEKHDSKVRDVYKLKNGYPNILKCSGIPWYLAVKDQLSDSEYSEYLESWIKTWSDIATKHKQLFKTIKTEMPVETGAKNIWEIKHIDVSSFDNQLILIVDDKGKKNTLLLSDFFMLIESGTFRINAL